MQAILIFCYLLLILGLGYALVSLIFPSRTMSFEKIFSLSGLVGLGAAPLLLFCADLVAPGGSKVLLVLLPAAVAVLLLILSRRGGCARISGSLIASFYGPGGGRMVLFLPAAVILSSLAIVACHSLMTPLYEWDAFAIWFLKAKVLYSEGLGNSGYFSSRPLSYSHLDYPLLVPYLVEGAYCFCGGVNDVLARSIFPFAFLCFFFFLVTALSKYCSRIIVMVLAAFYLSIPSAVRWWGSGSADIVLAIFNFCSAYYIFSYIRGRDDRRKILLALIFSAFGAFTKNEGMALAAINALVLLAYLALSTGRRERLKGAAPYVLVPLMMILPWIIFSWNIPRIHENYGGRLNIAEISSNLWKMKLVVRIFLQEFANFAHWGVLWAALGIVLFRFKSLRSLLYLWTVLAGYVALFALVFSVSPRPLEYLATMSLDRLLLQISPVAFFIVAVTVSDILREEGEGDELSASSTRP